MKTNGRRYERHSLSAAYRQMTPQELAILKSSIARDGFNPSYPIVLFEGEILDGYNRYRACEELGVEPTFRDFEGTKDQAIAYVQAANLARRQLTKTEIANYLVWHNAQIPEADRMDRLDLQRLAGVSDGIIRDAMKNLDHDEDLARQVGEGELSGAAARAKRRGVDDRVPLSIRFSTTRSRAIAVAKNEHGLSVKQLVDRAVDHYIAYLNAERAAELATKRRDGLAVASGAEA